MLDVQETIVAIASAAAPARRGILRISGPQALPIVAACFQTPDEQQSTWQSLQRADRFTGHFWIDEQLRVAADAIVWPNQRSYTRQPTVEIHTWGSLPVLRQMVDRVLSQGARLAQPGEFTMRAFLSGRIDLTQAEAVLAVIDADSQNKFDTALQQLAGGLAGPLGDLRTKLLSVLAEVEAGLDFVEEDIQFISVDQTLRQLRDCQRTLDQVVQQIQQREVENDFDKVVLTGLPNSGKSSLFNALTESSRAIVTNIAGTTTDFISATVAIQQTRINLIDTAGFESASGAVSATAQQHLNDQIATADLRVLCIDTTRLGRNTCDDEVTWRGAAPEFDSWLHRQLTNQTSPCLIVGTKSDLTGWEIDGPAQPGSIKFHGRPLVVCSSVTGDGVQSLRAEIVSALVGSSSTSQSVVGSTVHRASSSLTDAAESLSDAIDAAQNSLGEEIVAAAIRESLNALGHVVGTVYTDDILDLVFGRFCIGK